MRVHADPSHLVGPSSNLQVYHKRQPKLRVLANVLSSLSSHKGTRHRLLVSPIAFVCCWWFIAFMHFFNGTLALVFSILYLFFSLPSIFPSIAVIELSLPLLKISGWAYMVVAAIHWYALARIIWRSVQSRQLSFSARVNPATSKCNSSQLGSSVRVKLKHFRQSFWKPWNRSFGVEGVFGVNGRYFYVAFLAREAIEVALQTYQAYQLSGSVRRSWVTDLAVGVIVLNSVSTPLVYAILHRHQESARRFMSILVDMSLDFCCAAIIPLCVVVPYITAYDIAKGSMPVTLLNDDVWFTSSMIEIRQFCVTSALDFHATMMPHVTVYTCLVLAQKVVQRDLNTVAAPGVKSKRFSMVIVASPEPSTAGSSHSSHHPPSTKRSMTTQRLHGGFHCLVILWSAVVLWIHIRASVHARASATHGCRLSLNAWFAVGTPCSIMQLNCHRLQIDGRADEIAALLRPLDRTVLRKLLIIHCPALEIPPLLCEFGEMTDLEIYNSTLVSWPREAAATPLTMKSLVNFYWLQSPYIGFPAGLLHSNLPHGFSRFSIARSNVTELPPDLGTLWSLRTLDVFGLEFANVTHLPPSFADLSVRKLRLISNHHFNAIDNHALATKQLTELVVSGCPLREWPVSLGDTSMLLDLQAEFTNVTALSPPVTDWWNRPSTGLFSHHSFSGFGSGLCDSMPTETYCKEDAGSWRGTFEWDLIGAQRSLDA